MRQIVARCALVPAVLLGLTGCGTPVAAPTPLPLPTLAAPSSTLALPACPTGDVFTLDGQHLSENGADYILHVTGDRAGFRVTWDRTSPSAGLSPDAVHKVLEMCSRRSPTPLTLPPTGGP